MSSNEEEVPSVDGHECLGNSRVVVLSVTRREHLHSAFGVAVDGCERPAVETALDLADDSR